MKIPVTGKVYTAQDRDAMMECLLSGEEITYGSWNQKFEKMLADFVGTRFAYFVNSGSSANLLAFAAFTSPQMYPHWRVRPGDEIITVAAGFPTTVAPIVQFGAVPVFVDIDETYNIDVTQLERALSEKTKGVFIAHTLGNPFDVDSVLAFCEEHNLFLIEDNADALGSKWGDRHTGSFGQVSTTSFYPAHHMTTGQGGAVFTSDPLIAKILMSMRNWGKACVCQPNENDVCQHRFTQKHGDLPLGYDHKYVFSNFGFNLQGTNILAALGCAQMERIEEFTKTRHRNYGLLYDGLSDDATLPITLPLEKEAAIPSWFGFPILLDEGIDRTSIIKELTERGVDTRTLFAGNIIRQPCFTENDDVKYRIAAPLSMTRRVAERLFWVGCWHGLSTEQMYELLAILKEVLHGKVT